MSARFAIGLSALSLFVLLAPAAHAGFGITPPYVINPDLGRDSVYEQKIVISRNDPVEDLRAQISVVVPGAEDWITIDKGKDFVLPRGEVQVPMVVKVHVPTDARYGDYKGYMRVILAPAGGPTAGTVGISLGAQLDVRLRVVDKKIYSFNVQAVRVDDLEEGHAWWRYFFPGDIRFAMQVENTGNVEYGPTKVLFTIRDAAGVKEVETTQNIFQIPKIKPFQTDWVTAELPTRLTHSAYRASFAIYNGDTVVRKGDLSLSVQPYGAIPNYRGGFGFLGLTRSEQIEMVAGILAILAILGGGGAWIWRRLRRWQA